MLMSSMKINSIFKCSLTMILIIPLLSQCISASSQDAIFNNTVQCDWQQSNIFFYSYGLGTELEINNQSSHVNCFKKDVRLSIYYRGFWPLWVKFKVWNNTGVIADFNEMHCALYVTNFTGLIIHSIYQITEGHVWYLFGYCTYLKIQTGYN